MKSLEALGVVAYTTVALTACNGVSNTISDAPRPEASPSSVTSHNDQSLKVGGNRKPITSTTPSEEPGEYRDITCKGTPSEAQEGFLMSANNPHTIRPDGSAIIVVGNDKQITLSFPSDPIKKYSGNVVISRRTVDVSSPAPMRAYCVDDNKGDRIYRQTVLDLKSPVEISLLTGATIARKKAA